MQKIYIKDNDFGLIYSCKEKYYFQNGGREFLREFLLDNNNLSKKDLITAIESFNNK